MSKLRSVNAYWTSESMQRILYSDIENLSREELEYAIKELDRRFMQLWDKIGYENEWKKK